MMATKVLALERQGLHERPELLVAMHRLRARIFCERLAWDVAVSSGAEADRYDTADATYLLVISSDDDVVGHVRLLPTTGPNMLADTFPRLLDGNAVPRGADLVESSRFCVDTSRLRDRSPNGVHRATFMLLAAMLEWSLENDMSAIVTVTDVRMERILRRAAWPLERLGEPHEIGATRAVAGLLPVDRASLERIRLAGALCEPVLERRCYGSNRPE